MDFQKITDEFLNNITSHVLKTIGLTPQDAQGSLRVSLGRFTNEEDVDYFIEKLPPIIERLRKISLF